MEVHDEHQLNEEHPPFCGPCAVFIADQDCLQMGVERVSVTWTGNLTPEKVIKVLQRAIKRMKMEVKQQQ